MTTYNTGNAIGSTDPRDLFDNAENLDSAVNDLASATWVDRFGVTRTTLAGQIGYIGTGAGGAIESYASGLELTTFSTIIEYNGEFYRPSSSATLPYTTTATLPDVDSNLVAVGDAVLRQDLASNASGSGSDLVSHVGKTETVTDALNSRTTFVENLTALKALSADYRVDGYLFLLATSDSQEGSVYKWDAASTETADDVRYVESDGTATGRFILADYRRQTIGRTTGGGEVDDTYNMLGGRSKNYIAEDVHSCTIAGGGSTNSENVIGGLVANVGDSGTSNVDPAGGLGSSARYAVIGGGYDNVNNSLASVITGMHCYIETAADHGTISGGSFHKIVDGSYNTISGGTQNEINDVNGVSTISGGSEHTITSQRGTIGGGQGHTVSGDFATVGGGQTNTTTGDFSAVLSGSGNTVNQERGLIGGGSTNSVTAAGSQRWGAVLSGGNNTVEGEGAAVIHGRNNTAEKDWSSASGYQAIAKTAGQQAHAAGNFSAEGDAQFSDNLMKVTTTDATVTLLRFQDSGTDISTTANIAVHYRIQVLGHRTDVEGENGLILLEGLAYRESTGGWVFDSKADELFGEAVDAGGGDVPWTAQVLTSGAALRVNVSGEAAKTINWVAKVELLENIG